MRTPKYLRRAGIAHIRANGTARTACGRAVVSPNLPDAGKKHVCRKCVVALIREHEIYTRPAMPWREVRP